MRGFLVVLVISFGSFGSLEADTLTYTVMANAGEFSYEFTLTNTGDTGGALFDLFLSVPTDISNIETSVVGVPVGWGDTTGGLLFYGPDTSPSTSFIEWASDFSGLYDVEIGASLSRFSFNSVVGVGQPITFALNGSTHFFSAEEASTVPEPGTFGLGVVVLAGLCLRSKSIPGAIT